MNQLSLFAATDTHILEFMAAFARLEFGKPDSWCGCQRCRYARLVDAVKDGTISAAGFEIYYRKFLEDGYIAPGKIINDSYTILGEMGYSYARK